MCVSKGPEKINNMERLRPNIWSLIFLTVLGFTIISILSSRLLKTIDQNTTTFFLDTVAILFGFFFIIGPWFTYLDIDSEKMVQRMWGTSKTIRIDSIKYFYLDRVPLFMGLGGYKYLYVVTKDDEEININSAKLKKVVGKLKHLGIEERDY